MSIESTAPWVQTVSGVAFDLLTPRAEDVRIADIAISLARLNRYAGHTVEGYALRGYSVAQHSVLVSNIVEQWGAPLEIVREALLHDASEAYYGDITSPVQRAMRAQFQATLAELAEEVLFAFGEDAPIVRKVADRILSWAARNDPFRRVKHIVDPVVREALGMPGEEHDLVKRADLVALACERVGLMMPCERNWNLPEFPDRRWTTIQVLEPQAARDSFLQRLEALERALNERTGTAS